MEQSSAVVWGTEEGGSVPPSPGEAMAAAAVGARAGVFSSSCGLGTGVFVLLLAISLDD